MKKNKILTTALMVSALTIGSLVPVSAATDNVATGDTNVWIDVVENIEDAKPSINVTVPTSLLLTVVADKTQQDGTPKVLVSSTINGSNNTIVPGEGVGTIEFTNKSSKLGTNGEKIPAEVYINDVTVSSALSGWTLVNAIDPDATEKSLKMSLSEIGADGGSTNTKVLRDSGVNALGGMTLAAPSNLDLGTSSYLRVNVEANGKNKIYNKTEHSENAFVLTWNISGTQK